MTWWWEGGEGDTLYGCFQRSDMFTVPALSPVGCVCVCVCDVCVHTYSETMVLN